MAIMMLSIYCAVVMLFLSILVCPLVTWLFVFAGEDRSIGKGRTVLISLCILLMHLVGGYILILSKFGSTYIFFKKLTGLYFTYQELLYTAMSAFVLNLLAYLNSFVFRRLVYEHAPRVSHIQEIAAASSFVFSIAFLMLSFYIADCSKNGISVSKVHADESYVLLNDVLINDDHVFLKNEGLLPLDLSAYYLSDDEREPLKMQLSDMLVAPETEVAVLLTDDGPFKLSSAETVYLFDQKGLVIDKRPVTEDRDAKPLAPVFSKESGFYDSEFMLDIKAPSGTRIYYTLDGSNPGTDSKLYEGPIRVRDKKGDDCPCRRAMQKDINVEDIDRAFVLRAICADADGNKSDTANAVYFIGENDYDTKDVISITVDREDLFGADGISVAGAEHDAWEAGGRVGVEPKANYLKSGRYYERQANISYIHNGVYEGSQDAGIRVFGASSRSMDELKRYSLTSRDVYSGNDCFELPFFDDRRLLHSVNLRPYVSDALLQDMAGDRDVATQEHKAVSVFINGEFWYDTFLCEKYDPYYFFERYGIPSDDLIVIKGGEIIAGTDEDMESYDEIIRFISENDLSDDENYRALSEMMDIQSYIDFICINMISCNVDIDNTKNQIIYRSRTGVNDEEGDGRFRWGLYDMDAIEWTAPYYEEHSLESSSQFNLFEESYLVR